MFSLLLEFDFNFFMVIFVISVFANVCFYYFILLVLSKMLVFFLCGWGAAKWGGRESAKCSGMGVTQAALKGRSGARSGIVVGSACVRFLAL